MDKPTCDTCIFRYRDKSFNATLKCLLDRFQDPACERYLLDDESNLQCARDIFELHKHTNRLREESIKLKMWKKNRRQEQWARKQLAKKMRLLRQKRRERIS